MNIQKHAHASHVLLRAHATEETIVIELKDDGDGFDTTAPPTGFGIQGMGERTYLIGGTLSIDSAIGQGTMLNVRIPR